MKISYVLIYLLSLTSCSLLSSRRDIASIQSKPNEEVIKYWETKTGEKRFLIHESIASKARVLKLLKKDKNGRVTNQIIEDEATTEVYGKNWFTVPWKPKFQEEPRDHLYRYSLKNRQKYKLKITDDDSWINEKEWEKVPLQNIDPRRKILELQTHDNIPFYSLYAVPDNYDASKVYPIVIMLYGGTTTYNQEVEKGHYMDEFTPDFLLKNNFIVLFASFRGKKWLGNTYRKSGIGKMHTNGIKDIVTALDSLSKNVKFDHKKLNVIGHSRGGHMAALFATRLHEVSKKYSVDKTLVSSGILNTVDGYYNFYKPMSPYKQVGSESLDFSDDDWTGGALCFRPSGKFSDQQWEKIKETERKHFEKYLLENYKVGKPLCNTKAYFNQSPYHHYKGFQGEMLILVGDDEEGTLHPEGATQFQTKVGIDRVTVDIHSYGHGGFYGNNHNGDIYWINKLKDFFNIP